MSDLFHLEIPLYPPFPKGEWGDSGGYVFHSHIMAGSCILKVWRDVGSCRD